MRIDPRDGEKVARQAADLVAQGCHWSEGVVLAVGGHLWGGVDERTRRMTSGLAGGLGGTHQEMCGALSGGALIIGALYGRASVDEEDTECYRLVSLYRDRFLARFGTTCCQDLRDSGYGSEGQWPCSELVDQATRILWGVLEE